MGDYSAAQQLLELAVAQESMSAKRELAIFLESHNGDLDRARELREEIGPDNILDELVDAAAKVREFDEKSARAEDGLVNAASSCHRRSSMPITGRGRTHACNALGAPLPSGHRHPAGS
jgi:hypothetical protein